ncbi:MAG: hypothetical protein CBCREVIR_3584 [Candidatus Burkholderia crenata]|nr:MAG: hypothetical protein CBCREVIR_3584 [Candidatus Burkholderia crenata]
MMIKFEKCMEIKMEIKKVMWDVNCKVHEELQKRLDLKEEEKELFRIARLKDKNSKDLDGMRCMKSINDIVLVKDKEIKQRSRD